MIEPGNPVLSIGKQCGLLSISRSSFYYTPKGETALNLMLMHLILFAKLADQFGRSQCASILHHPRFLKLERTVLHFGTARFRNYSCSCFRKTPPC